MQKSDFDRHAAAWDADPERIRRTQAIAEAIGEGVPVDPSMTAMEYGCGTGLLSFPLSERFKQILLVDSSQGMLDVLSKKIGESGKTNMRALNADLLVERDVRLEAVSVIYSALVLHHVGDVEKIFTIWHSLLKSPGYLFIADLDKENGMFHGPEFTGHNGFDRESLGAIARATGFIGVRFRTVVEITKTCRDGMLRRFPVFLLTCRKA
jgi:2-polyprenyl-3-methyl-5-hydroxy-6-metoxy-1,4-benzoquinol methylase